MLALTSASDCKVLLGDSICPDCHSNGVQAIFAPTYTGPSTRYLAATLTEGTNNSHTTAGNTSRGLICSMRDVRFGLLYLAVAVVLAVATFRGSLIVICKVKYAYGYHILD